MYDRDNFLFFFIKFKNELFEPHCQDSLAKRRIVRGRRTMIFFPSLFEPVT